MVNPVGLAAILLGVSGVVLGLLGKGLSGFPYAQFLVFGPLLIALAFALGAVAFGLRNPLLVILIFAVASIVLVGIDAFQWLGPNFVF